MERKILKNKPLVEAIFELRWELKESELLSRMEIDPHYSLMVGRIYDKVRDEYPFHEQLQTAIIPDVLVSHVVQHRFRKNKDEWPLIQVGPGIITLNDTEGYIWDDFEDKIHYLLDAFFDIYPTEDLQINELLLRYIDAIDFDYEQHDIFGFMKENMKIKLDLHKHLFEHTGVSESPLNFDLTFSFPSTNPKGAINLRFTRGKRKDVDALIWETRIQSVKKDAPQSQIGIETWIKEAHKLADDWFFKIIEGELQTRFE